MDGQEEHFGKQEIYYYVRGLISIEKSDRMEEHMRDCDECLLKTVQVRHEMIRGCAKASGLFEEYFDKALNRHELGFVEAHLISCDPCADEYGALVERKTDGDCWSMNER